MLAAVSGDSSQETPDLSPLDRSLLGRWEGNRQELQGEWDQVDCYIFARDRSYVVAIRAFNPETEEWKKPDEIDQTRDDGFSGEFRTQPPNHLLLDHWFAPRILEFEVQGDQMRLYRNMVEAAWTVRRVDRCGFEDEETALRIDKFVAGTLTPSPEEKAALAEHRRRRALVDQAREEILAGNFDSSILEQLSTLTNDDDPHIRSAAVTGFCAFTEPHPYVVKEMDAVLAKIVPRLKDPEGFVRRAAALCLSDFGPLATSAIPELVERMRKEFDADVGWFSADALGNMGSLAAPAIPDLVWCPLNNIN